MCFIFICIKNDKYSDFSELLADALVCLIITFITVSHFPNLKWGRNFLKININFKSNDGALQPSPNQAAGVSFGVRHSAPINARKAG